MEDPHIQYSFETFSDTGELPDLNNVQGDIIYLFPKAAEIFIFFRIKDVAAFKVALKDFKPTNSADVKRILLDISNTKLKAAKEQSNVAPYVKVAQFQIAFSRMGMNTLGVKEPTGDARFDKFCMRDNKDFLGDQRTWDDIFNKSNFDSVNGSVNDDTGALHGVVTVAGKTPEDCSKASEGVINLFGSSMTVAGGKAVEGRARPDQYKGHEHFGYKDGISQPALRGVVAPRPGQTRVDLGVILMGYKGDPVFDDPNPKVKRPAWAKDGTILVFRKLEQDAIGFEDFATINGKRWREFIPGGTITPPLTDREGADLFGARCVGRWKSGAPLARSPFRDNPEIAIDPDRNNDFDYIVRDNPDISCNTPSDYDCPFTAHTRKTEPRNLDPYISKKFLESGSLVRGGLPYGPEITPKEREEYKKDPTQPSPRGLLFNCYMSSLDDGFIRQTIAYANNDYFPPVSLFPHRHGRDPIIGGPSLKKSSGEERSAVLEEPFKSKTRDEVHLAPVSDITNETTGELGLPGLTPADAQPPPGANKSFFVVSRGGEYFFVPSIPTLKAWAN